MTTSLVSKRIQEWCKFSYESSLVPALNLQKLQLTDQGLVVEISQAKCQRIRHRRDSQSRKYLKALRETLDEAWTRGLVHGDLNRKNILLTTDGFRVVDIEPLICVPTSNDRILLRSTPPYIAHSDLMQATLTKASDRLGFNCFAAWISGFVDVPWKALKCTTITCQE